VETYSIVKSTDEGVAYVVMQHRNSSFNEGKAETPSVVICECDTLEMATKVAEALSYFKDKPYGACGSCLQLIDDVFDTCPYCGAN
tara:strand:+ start:1421 stop:1678 length:258 start_codon:yes stop_codon:yes gene_type:complete